MQVFSQITLKSAVRTPLINRLRIYSQGSENKQYVKNSSSYIRAGTVFTNLQFPSSVTLNHRIVQY
jgi:hypothetical protein